MADASSSAFLDATALLVIGGASTAVTVITNTAQALLKKTSPWIPFVAAVVIVGATTLTSGKRDEPMTWLLAFINACLLFCTAAGIQGVIGHIAAPQAPPAPPAANLEPSFGSRWTQSWLRAPRSAA